jgi:zinc protease
VSIKPAFLLTLVLTGMSFAPLEAQASQIPDHPNQLRLPPLRPIVPPRLTRLELEKGARLLVIESDELPLVDGSLIFRGGKREEAPKQAGLAELMADVLREGGSQHTPGPRLDRWLDSHAATLDIRVEQELLRIDFSCVASDIETVLEAIGELLMIPAYPQDELEKSRRRLLTGLVRRNEDVGQLAGRLLDRVCYGEDSRVARRPTLESVSALTREDLINFHHSILGADRLVVGATGAVDPALFAARISLILNRLPVLGPARPHEIEVFRRPSRTRIYLHDRPNLSQTEIRLAAPGTRRVHRDYVPLYLWSYVVGAGGTSNRMMIRLRTELGLIYRGEMYFAPLWDRAGRMLGSCSTGNSTVGEVVRSLIEILEGASKPIPPEEFEAVRERLQNSLVFEIDSPKEVLERALEMELHGNPSDFWEQRDAALHTVTRDEVAAAVGRYLDTDRLVFLVVGPADELQVQLEALGEVIRLPAAPVEASD